MDWPTVLDWADMINGTLEFAGGLFILLSVVKLHRDKIVRGVSLVHASFFSVWGYWNLFYYPHLDQWMSFAGGVFIVATNTVWIIQLLYWTDVERRQRNKWRDERRGNRWRTPHHPSSDGKPK